MTTTAIGSATSGPASCRVASMPSMPGIRMSSRQTSGRSSRARATASRPSAASPITSMPGWASRIMRRPVRTSSWSSATSTRMRHARRAVPRQDGADRPAAGGVGPGLERAAEQRGALASCPRARSRRRPGAAERAAAPVVADRQRARSRSSPATETAMRVAVRACRSALVIDSCDEPVDRGLDRWAEVVEVAGQLDVDPRPVSASSASRSMSATTPLGKRGRAPRPSRRSAHHAAHLGERARGGLLDDRERVDGGVRPGCGERRARPGPGWRSPRRGGRRCRAARGPAARARGA